MRMPSTIGLALFLALGLTATWLAGAASAAEEEKSFSIGDGAYSMPFPTGWTRKPPKFNLIEHEFEAPASEGDEKPGRATISNSGGTIEANIDRWYGQFRQPDGSSTKDKAKIENKKIADSDVTIVDITGTYDDKVAPFSPMPGVQREGYRMLAAVVATKKAGNYYIKFYGPKKTIGDQEESFKKMVEGLQAK